MTYEDALVSVIIPLYNRQDTIQRAVDSVLSQSYSNIEVLVVDDGSTDHSIEMLEKYHNDNRVRIFCQEYNQGANAARNRGIREAKGDYIAFHDSDDEWLPDKLEKQIKRMEYGDFQVSFCAFKRQYPKTIQIIPDISEYLSSDKIKERLKKANIVGTPTLVIHREVVHEIGIFDEEMPRLQDYELAIRIAKKYDICFVNEVLVIEYQLDDCISLNQKSLHEAYALLLKKHSDFLDIGYIWNQYLETGNEITSQNIDWDKLDEVIGDITKRNGFCTKDDLYKAAINQISEKYFRMKYYEEQKFKNILNKLVSEKFVVYGAGFFARQAADMLEKRNLLPKYFIVSSKDGTDSMNNIPVIQLSEWNEPDMIVILAVSGKAQEKIIADLQKKGRYNYYIYPDCI
ncbi:MAG: hypothetical protein DBY13_00970 [Lachnospiraceae bacterium]|nr:MAG: hypothetical protein DBY13_00970 [Lachnospiraceae bacterium]